MTCRPTDESTARWFEDLKSVLPVGAEVLRGPPGRLISRRRGGPGTSTPSCQSVRRSLNHLPAEWDHLFAPARCARFQKVFDNWTQPPMSCEAELPAGRGRARRNSARWDVFSIVQHTRSLTSWGRTGFDGDMSGLWLHAELIAS